MSIANRKTTPQACKEAEITRANLLPLAEKVRRLKELEKENGKLKRLVAELSPDKQILEDFAEGNL